VSSGADAVQAYLADVEGETEHDLVDGPPVALGEPSQFGKDQYLALNDEEREALVDQLIGSANRPGATVPASGGVVPHTTAVAVATVFLQRVLRFTTLSQQRSQCDLTGNQSIRIASSLQRPQRMLSGSFFCPRVTPDSDGAVKNRRCQSGAIMVKGQRFFDRLLVARIRVSREAEQLHASSDVPQTDEPVRTVVIFAKPKMVKFW
jgi:hypothetical protein